ncbi:hypothetical protein D3C75_1321360 [compost metagenome]
MKIGFGAGENILAADSLIGENIHLAATGVHQPFGRCQLVHVFAIFAHRQHAKFTGPKVRAAH